MTVIGELSRKYAEQYPEQFAQELATCSVKETADILSSLTGKTILRVSAHLGATQLRELILNSLLSADKIFAGSTLDEASVLLTRLPRDLSLALVTAVTNKSKQRELRRYLNYPPHSVGAIATSASLQFLDTDLVSGIIVELSQFESQEEPAIVIVDATGKYIGVLDTWKMLPVYKSKSPVSRILSVVEPLRAEFEHSTAITDAQWATRNWLPVVDHQNRLVGICRSENLKREQVDSEMSSQMSLLGTVDSVLRQAYRVLALLLEAVLSRSKI